MDGETPPPAGTPETPPGASPATVAEPAPAASPLSEETHRAILSLLMNDDDPPAGSHEPPPASIHRFFRAVVWCVHEYKTNAAARDLTAITPDPSTMLDVAELSSIHPGLVEAKNDPPPGETVNDPKSA